MINSSIKARVFLIAFIPMLFITTYISIYFMQKQLTEIDNSISTRGTTMAMHLANASEYGMFSGNQDNLNSLLQYSIREEGILSISITDKSGNIFISAESKESENVKTNTTQPGMRYFRHPILLNTTSISDIDDFESNANANANANNVDEILGWIEIAISTRQMGIKRGQIIRDSMLIILTGLIISTLLSIWLGRRITNPILQLTRSVHSIESGNLDEKIDAYSPGEIGMLEKGFMSMLGKIRISQKDLQDKIDATTLGLKNSLKIVEKQNQELTEARTRALEASKTKSRFLANISHEIRTPMNGILGFARLLKKTRLSKEQYDYLDTIEKSSSNLLHLLEDILDISRIEEGKISINSKAFDLRQCIEDAVSLMSPAAQEKGLEIVNHFYNDVPNNITAPHERIRQVLINFLGNAIKFSEKGTITIRTMLDPDDDNLLRLSVSDQGIGIPDSEKEHIFSPFTQIDDTSTRKYQGSGLGLAISKSISKAMGGFIGLDDNDEGGTTFWFTFPYHANNQAESATKRDNAQKTIPVFLYDSNPESLPSIHADITNSGYSVTSYTDSNILINKIGQYYGECIYTLSVTQDEINNKNILKIIKSITESPTSRLILIVSPTNPADNDIISNFEADALLTKPYRHQDLISSLHHLASSSPHETTSGYINHEKNAAPIDLNGLDILIAEDNAINTKLLKSVLSNSGARITHAHNGEEAVNLFNQSQFDLILMDIQMPGMTGIDATNAIRTSGKQGASIPIIGMTANALSDDIKTYMKAGFSNILIKPISVDNLLSEINYWIKKEERKKNSVDTEQKLDKQHIKEYLNTSSSDTSSLGINKTLSDDLYKLLIDELPAVTNQLKESFTEKNWDSLRKQIHKLLGGISYCNVPELKHRTLAFQDSLKNQARTLSDDFEALITEIEKLT